MSQMKPERLNYLFQNYFDKTATEKERDELMQIINDPLQEEAIKGLMEDVFMSNTSNNTGNDVFAQGQKEKMLEAVFAVQDGKPESRSAIVKNLVKTSWIKYAAVAILLLSVDLN